MNKILAVFDFIDELEQQKDDKSLQACFTKLIRDFGFSHYCVGDPSCPKLVRDDRLWGTNWPNEWILRWFSKNYITFDPVIHQLACHNMPFRWADLRYRTNGLPGRVMDEATDFGMKDGFGVPVHNVNGSCIGVTLSTEHYEIGKQEEVALHMATLYFQAKFARLRPPTSKPGNSIQFKLTPRERECLAWVAAGKSDWDISQILGISEDTAHEYVHNGIAKLGATTRAQAVAIGILEGLIRP
jgi:LuxR family transcriptional regulator, quorum-sensing system regulator BjaR1